MSPTNVLKADVPAEGLDVAITATNLDLTTGSVQAWTPSWSTIPVTVTGPNTATMRLPANPAAGTYWIDALTDQRWASARFEVADPSLVPARSRLITDIAPTSLLVTVRGFATAPDRASDFALTTADGTACDRIEP